MCGVCVLVRACVHAFLFVCLRACVHDMRARARACVCVCVCKCGGGGGGGGVYVRECMRAACPHSEKSCRARFCHVPIL